MTLEAFDDAKRVVYVAGVAQSLSLAPSAVDIASVTQQFSGRRRRRLLAESVAVETVVTVSKEQASTVAAATTVANLNAALASSGISVGDLSARQIGSASTGSTSGDAGGGSSATSSNDNTGVIAGAGAGVAVLAILVGAWMWWRCRRSSREESHKLEEGEHWLELSNGENFLCS